MTVRCKFKVAEVTTYEWGAEKITLNAVYGRPEDSKENQSFAKATPTGMLTFQVDNPAVIGSFVPGKEYYIDLSPA